jgi:hypothetical protein
MEWVLFVSLQWVVSGSPTPPNTTIIESFASEQLCKKAADAIKAEMEVPVPGQQRVTTMGRVTCLLRKEK